MAALLGCNASQTRVRPAAHRGSPPAIAGRPPRRAPGPTDRRGNRLAIDPAPLRAERGPGRGRARGHSPARHALDDRRPGGARRSRARIRGCDSDAILAWITEQGAVPVIPPHPSRATTRETDWCLYEERAGRRVPVRQDEALPPRLQPLRQSRPPLSRIRSSRCRLHPVAVECRQRLERQPIIPEHQNPASARPRRRPNAPSPTNPGIQQPFRPPDHPSAFQLGAAPFPPFATLHKNLEFSVKTVRLCKISPSHSRHPRQGMRRGASQTRKAQDPVARSARAERIRLM